MSSHLIDNQFSVVIPAAGVGSRMQANLPKQYLLINKQTILEHTLARWLTMSSVKRIVVALHPDDEHFDNLKITSSILSHPKVVTVIGGENRADSVRNSLSAISAFGEDPQHWVMVHDAARPNIACTDIEKLWMHCFQNNTKGGILATRVRDTMKRGGTTVMNTVERSDLWHALTPQCFLLGDLLDSLLNTNPQKITDEASAMEQRGFTVDLIEGQASNIKVTQPEDLPLMTWYLSQDSSSELIKKGEQS